jgi:hypothetical protein
VSLLAEQVPEHHRELVGHVVDTDLLGALDQGLLAVAGGRHAGEIALDVGGKHRNARVREALRQHLQGNGLARARGSGHKAVPVGEPQIEIFGLRAFPDENLPVLQHRILQRLSMDLRSVAASFHSRIS